MAFYWNLTLGENVVQQPDGYVDVVHGRYADWEGKGVVVSPAPTSKLTGSSLAMRTRQPSTARWVSRITSTSTFGYTETPGMGCTLSTAGIVPRSIGLSDCDSSYVFLHAGWMFQVQGFLFVRVWSNKAAMPQRCDDTLFISHTDLTPPLSVIGVMNECILVPLTDMTRYKQRRISTNMSCSIIILATER